MLVEMKSPAFMDHGQERRLTTFHGGLNVVLGEEDGAMSIGKSSSLLAIDLVLFLNLQRIMTNRFNRLMIKSVHYVARTWIIRFT